MRDNFIYSLVSNNQLRHWYPYNIQQGNFQRSYEIEQFKSNIHHMESICQHIK